MAGRGRGEEPVAAGAAQEQAQPRLEAQALCERVEQETWALMGALQTMIERGSPHPLGRRLALTRSKLEEAWLQARQGKIEAHFDQ